MKKGFTLIRTLYDKNLVKVQRGFTLIELLIVIAIIGILAALSVFGTQDAFKQSRDTQRKSDLNQYKTALELYANKNNGWYYSPASGSVETTSNSSTFCPSMFGNASLCPTDPSTGTYRYYADGDGSNGPTATNYFLKATLEGVSKDWIVCSNGKSGEVMSGGTYMAGSCPI